MPLRTDSYRKNTKNTQNGYNHEINHKSEQNVEVKTSKLRNTASNDSVPRQKSSSFPALLWIKTNIRGMHWIRHQFTLFKSCLVKFLLRSQRVAPLICRLLASDKLIQMLLATSTLALDLWNFKEQSSQCLCSVLILISQCVISILAWASKLEYPSCSFEKAGNHLCKLGLQRKAMRKSKPERHSVESDS